MISFRRAISLAVSVALLSTTATPAFAGWGGTYVSSSYGWGGGYGGYGRHHRHHDRVDAGDVIGVVAVVGIIAAIASAASKSKQAKRYPTNDGYPDRRDDRARSSQGSITSEDAAVDACANATEAQAGERASVREISQVDRNADGWDVEGVVEQRDSWRNGDAEKRRFTCSVRFGEIEHVYIDNATVALR
jgi:hypothetical protein